MTMATAANSGIPAGLRRITTDDIEAMLDPKPIAAGVLMRDPAGRVLLMKRAGTEANYAGHWGLPGGGIEDGETPEQAARRELREETGHDHTEALDEIDSVVTGTGRGKFVTFGGRSEAFEPQMRDGEHTAFQWADPKSPPQPLHPGVERMLAKLENNQDFNLSAGDKEIVATDSALTLALDRDSLREKDRDGRMRVASSNISKATVNPYKGHEVPKWQELGLDPNRIYHLLRDPEEMKKAVKSFNGIQILRKHIPVSAGDAQQWDTVGATGTNAEFDGEFLKNSLNIWTQEAIDDIESEAKRELSCGYHYDADMTPGEFNGMRFDGVMRNICGNHVALVKDGRAGPDVIVGDSNEEIAMTTAEQAKAFKAAAMRQVSIGALMTYLAPRLAKPHMAMDAKPLGIMSKVFDGVTGKNFKEQKPVLAARLREQTKGKLAQDATLDQVEKVLDMLDGHEIEGGDASVSPEQHNAMEAAAHGESKLDIPKKVGEEFAAKDAMEGLRNFAKEKGMADDDIEHMMSLMPKPGVAATDESPEDKEKREKAEAEKKATDAALELEKKESAAKDAAMKDMVTKPAMDQAISAAVTSAVTAERANARALTAAIEKVRPIVGNLAMAFDSAEQVYRHVLKMRGVPEADTIAASALETLINYQPKAGVEHRASPAIAQDEASTKGFNDFFPDADRIQDAV